MITRVWTLFSPSFVSRKLANTGRSAGMWTETNLPLSSISFETSDSVPFRSGRRGGSDSWIRSVRLDPHLTQHLWCNPRTFPLPFLPVAPLTRSRWRNVGGFRWHALTILSWWKWKTPLLFCSICHSVRRCTSYASCRLLVDHCICKKMQQWFLLFVTNGKIQARSNGECIKYNELWEQSLF